MAEVALVTGANRGIGFEVCRQLGRAGMTVVLGAREAAKGEEAAETLRAEGLAVHSFSVDVADAASVRRLAEQVAAAFGRLDVLVNNAGGFFDADQTGSGTSLAAVHEALETNLFGAWRMTQAFLPLLKESEHGRIVNVSSEAGSFGGEGGLGSAGFSAPGALVGYGVSKAALNALTVKLAAELKEAGVLVNAVCPGFTATHPGTKEMGARPVEEGAASIVWAAQVSKGGPTGGFFRDGKPLPW